MLPVMSEIPSNRLWRSGTSQGTPPSFRAFRRSATSEGALADLPGYKKACRAGGGIGGPSLFMSVLRALDPPSQPLAPCAILGAPKVLLVLEDRAENPAVYLGGLAGVEFGVFGAAAELALNAGRTARLLDKTRDWKAQEAAQRAVLKEFKALPGWEIVFKALEDATHVLTLELAFYGISSVNNFWRPRYQVKTTARLEEAVPGQEKAAPGNPLWQKTVNTGDLDTPDNKYVRLNEELEKPGAEIQASLNAEFFKLARELVRELSAEVGPRA